MKSELTFMIFCFGLSLVLHWFYLCRENLDVSFEGRKSSYLENVFEAKLLFLFEDQVKVVESWSELKMHH